MKFQRIFPPANAEVGREASLRSETDSFPQKLQIVQLQIT